MATKSEAHDNGSNVLTELGHLHAHGGRDHDHDHEHTTPNSGHPERKLGIALGLTALILVLEIVGGFMANSLALLADAAHMATDVFAVGLTWFAVAQSKRPADARRTFGYHRVGILAALLNAGSLLPISAFIIWEAIGRFSDPPEVQTGLMFGVAVVGLIANLLSGLTLHGIDTSNLNIRSAVIHVLGDALASAGVIVGAVIIAVTGWTPVDPILSILIALLVAVSGWRVVRETVRILLESAPKDIDVDDLVAHMQAVKGVENVHDLHIWQISQGINALSCHVRITDQLVSQSSEILANLNELLEHDFSIAHSTIQTECSGCDPNTRYCSLSPMPTADAHGHVH